MPIVAALYKRILLPDGRQAYVESLVMPRTDVDLARDTPRRLIREISWLNVAVASAGLSTLLYQLAVSRFLSVADFGLWNALLTLSVLMLIPGRTLELVVARQAAELQAVGASSRLMSYISRTLRNLGLRILFGAVLYLLLTPVLLQLLHTNSVIALLMLYPTAILGLLLRVGLGALEGLQKFALLGLCTGVWSVSMFLGIGLIELGTGATGAIMGQALANGLALAVSMIAVRYMLAAGAESRVNAHVMPVTSTGEGIVTALFAYGAVIGLLYIDVVFARHFLSEQAAGEYATVTVLGKALFYGPSAIVILVAPKVAAARSLGRSTVPYLWLGLGLTVLLVLPAAAALWTFPVTFLSTLFGDEYASDASAQVLRRYVFVTGALALVAVFSQYYLARRGTRFISCLLASLTVACLAMLVWHDTPVQIATSLLAGSVVGVASLTLLALYEVSPFCYKDRDAVDG